MSTFRLKVVSTGKLAVPKLTTGQYRELGNAMVTSMKKRLARGINVEGRRTKPLSPRYARIKGKKLGTRTPKRDMKLSGLTLRDFQVRRAWGGIVRAEPRNPKAVKRATFSQRIDLMIGLGLQEQRDVLRAARQMLGRRSIDVMWEKS